MYRRNRWRLSSTAAPGDVGELGVRCRARTASPTGSRGTRRGRRTRPAYTASRAISARPRAGGRQPARSPTQDDASIWNGSHGPTPPVMQRRREQRGRPEHEPERRAVHAPAEHEQEEHELDAARAGAEGAEGRADGGEHAEHGEGLGVHAPRRSARRARWRRGPGGRGRRCRARRGSWEKPAGGSITSGQANIASPRQRRDQQARWPYGAPCGARTDRAGRRSTVTPCTRRGPPRPRRR